MGAIIITLLQLQPAGIVRPQIAKNNACLGGRQLSCKRAVNFMISNSQKIKTLSIPASEFEVHQPHFLIRPDATVQSKSTSHLSCGSLMCRNIAYEYWLHRKLNEKTNLSKILNWPLETQTIAQSQKCQTIFCSLRGGVSIRQTIGWSRWTSCASYLRIEP